uniref:Uncharacterized protein n=1 Tax=Rhizophora mucronata TaxID=61149 RepID=A0A2P2QB37_RHIMU
MGRLDRSADFNREPDRNSLYQWRW